ncbi:hypothetical protein HN014_08195 [Aquimarina sp. TRL1]|uniref:hypothetical protein n=1 Tax=Aquimarina sp. (strain TRL1) TaxID=2736252 RepID=UPI001588C119|nr:hypothetical protein [Aquimarina sp. TRL1]QKX04899.1 hypothetical protein HN014_08195 [Aquimarina sp. TRL1]
MKVKLFLLIDRYFIGVVPMFKSFCRFRKRLDEKTRTRIISPSIIYILSDSEKAAILDDCVSEYKKTKDWKQTRIKEIL